MGTTSVPLVQPPTSNVDAYTLYLRGRHAWALASLEGFQAAASCFEQAVAADPNYAQAHAWLAYAYAMMGFDEFGLLPSGDTIPKVRAAATRAIELDDTLGDAHFAQALLAALYDWDWPRAQAEFERAVEPARRLPSRSIGTPCSCVPWADRRRPCRWFAGRKYSIRCRSRFR
jgi:tetratricopeptide (TPR) repeat protein